MEGFGRSCLTNLLLCLISGRESRKFLPDNFVHCEIKERGRNVKSTSKSREVKAVLGQPAVNSEHPLSVLTVTF